MSSCSIASWRGLALNCAQGLWLLEGLLHAGTTPSGGIFILKWGKKV